MKRSWFKKRYKWPRMPRKLKDRLPQYCEVCGATWPLTPAHRHNRDRYTNHVELLWDYNQVITACTGNRIHPDGCHVYLDTHKEYKARKFFLLRGRDKFADV